MGRPLLRVLAPALLVLAAFAVLVSLGNWQLRRLAWKDDLIARVAERMEAEPLDRRGEDLIEFGDPSSFLETNEYRPMLLTGEYVAGGEVRVFTSLADPRGPFGGPGYWVLTPFATPPSGAIVLVNRGFVPDDRKGDYAPPPAGAQTIEGLIRAPETGSWLTPKPQPAGRIFFVRDPRQINHTMKLTAGLDRPGYSMLMGFLIDLAASETPPGGLPQAGETRTVFPNSHLQYAITWYGLAAALLAVFGAFVMGRWRAASGPKA
jgi:surfeit locus 1 family protein